MNRAPFTTKALLTLALAVFLGLPQAAFAQAPAQPATAAAPQKVELLFVQNATGIAYDAGKGTLRLKNISRSTLFFTDRPVRMAGHYHTRSEFLPQWNEGLDSFAKNPPNATLSMLEVGKPDLQNAVIQLRNPRLQGKDLTYDITLIEGTIPPTAGDAVLFIDILGVWRRHIRRVAVVGTTAAVATAAAAKAATPPPAPAPAAQSASTQKLEQLKSMLNEGLITQAQYQKASQEVLNQVVQ